jgi:hypothetical protein
MSEVTAQFLWNELPDRTDNEMLILVLTNNKPDFDNNKRFKWQNNLKKYNE